MDEKLQAAIQAIQAGDTAHGSVLLAQAIKSDPKNETAWYWMAMVQDDVQKKKQCLQRVLQLNPGNVEACQGMELLDAGRLWPVIPEPPIPATPEAEIAPEPAPVIPPQEPEPFSAFSESPLQEPENLPAPAEETPADWFSAPAEPAAESSDWLKDLGSSPSESSFSSAQPETGAPDWLKGLGDTSSEPAQAEPDWLAGSASQEAPGEQPDWLSGAASFGAVEPAEPAQPGEVPDWLRAAQPAAPEEAASPAPAAGAGQMPDWLNSFRSEPAVEPAPEPEAPAEMPAQPGAVPDWLSSYKSITPAFTADDLSEEETSPEAESQPGMEGSSWGQPYPGQAQETTAPEIPPQEETTAAPAPASVPPFSPGFEADEATFKFDEPDMAARNRRTARQQQTGPFGLTRNQVIVLAALGLLALLFLIAAVLVFVWVFPNGLI